MLDGDHAASIKGPSPETWATVESDTSCHELQGYMLENPWMLVVRDQPHYPQRSFVATSTTPLCGRKNQADA